MPWEAGPSADLLDASDGLDRLALAAPLLGATGWIDSLGRLVAAGAAPPEGEALRDTLRDMFAPLGFGLRALSAGQGTASLVAARRTGRPPCTLLFPLGLAAPGPGWRRPPHALTRHGDRLHGHGIAQIKGAIAATWAALCVADAVGLRLRHDPVLLFTADAATGPGPALRALARQGELAGGPLLHLGGLAGPRRWMGAPGSLEVEIRVTAATTAAAAQAARPVLARLMELRAELGARAPGAEAASRLSVLSVQVLPEAGGESPACLLRLQRRFGAAEGAEAAEAGLRQTLAALPEADLLALRRLSLQPAVEAPEEGTQLLRWEQALRWGFGYGPQPFRPYACSEPSPLGHARGVGLVELLQGGLLRPGQPAGAAEESTTVEEVEALSRSLLAFLAEAAP
ncbi:hypothetical protein [Pseudoroseomonas cervicalis]|uniref:hypothetical protein n=1 Tax=Teichococcus cervicalis TaxID=204525 RepID=UPI0022F1A9DC|nr:hypothetical protein [Pseudoroseomonas cervicalis]WBV41768.1 hypothetical protein PFY06_11025 [Pseudoroseomonas cervicalis]